MNPATLLWLPDDLAHLIIEHVDGFDLARLSQTCGRCLAAHDALPGLLVRVRQCGAATWARAYRELARRQFAPRTWLTPRHAKIVARRRVGSAAAWATVAHTADCRTVGASGQGSSAPAIDLRVLVQNVGAEAVCFDPARIAVTWLACVDEAGRVAPVPCEILFAEIFARGHERRDARRRPGVETLGVLTWAAAIVRVAVPDCYYEGDFLERAVELRVPFVETGAVSYTHLTLPTKA